jgi:DNA-binding beta-propeller fold protein YncE
MKYILAILLVVSYVEARAQITLVRDKRIQSFLKNTKSDKDIFDPAIRSPKSAAFSEDGRKLYVNSLEGMQTAVYEWPSLKKLKVIDHNFNSTNQNLFQGEETVFNYKYYGKPSAGANYFHGKPVEMAFSHGGAFLWITYYRRDYDRSAQSPSAVAIVDTRTDEIVRVMPTGPIPKFVSISPDGRTAVITHWGDNTVGLIDISARSPKDFKYTSHLTVERQLSQGDKAGTDRDATCGFCLRGTVFTPDSRYLLIARMGGGGIAGFDLSQNKYLGSIMSLRATPRHLVVTADGKNLIVSSNVSGYITKFNLNQFVDQMIRADGKKINADRGQEVAVGSGARTIEVDPQGRYIFAAINEGIKVVAVDISTMKVVTEIKVDPFPVGLAISKDGNHLAITSQGHEGKGGGNSVNILRIDRRP